MKLNISIGDFYAEIEYPAELRLPTNLYLFESCSDDQREPDYYYKIHLTDTLPQITGDVIARREDLIVLRNESAASEADERKTSGSDDIDGNQWLESRVIGIHGMNQPYAVYREVAGNRAEIYYLKAFLPEISFDTVFTSLLALERRMISKDALILHCAYIQYRGEAILFSAPSGTGKSTQADLWERYRGSRTINGDRALLEKRDGRWIAGGWPICGSSEICNKEDTPIKAIVMLSQSPDNKSGRLSPLRSFRQLYSQITVNSWNTKSVEKVMDLIGDLQNCVPVYYLECNISEDAVACLESILYHTDPDPDESLT